MPSDRSAASFSLSVDLHASSSPEAIERLAQSLRQFEIPATWAVADPDAVASLAPLSRPSAQLEIALLTDRSRWQAAGDSHRFLADIARQIARAAARGLNVSTLAVRDFELREHADLLTGAGVRTLRTAGSPSARLSGSYPPPVDRGGLLRVAATARIPTQSAWGWNSSSAGLGRLLEASIGERASTHWVIDADRLERGGRSVRRQLEAWLADVAAARDDGRLRLSTLAGLASALRSQTPPRRQFRSILRAA